MNGAITMHPGFVSTGGINGTEAEPFPPTRGHVAALVAAKNGIYATMAIHGGYAASAVRKALPTL